jgi:5-methylcytosine-specific restriction endonuclease McrA
MSNRLQELRNTAYLKQGGRCHYCGGRMWNGDQKGHGLRYLCTAEHLIARCDGGADTEANIVAACWFCNTRRHRRTKSLAPEGYRTHVRRRLVAGRWHSG